MTSLSVFSFEGFEVRFVGSAERLEWIAADVCKVLALNTSEAVNGHKRNKADGTVYYEGGLDKDEKGMVILHTLGGDQEMLTVTEPGLYRLIFKSRKEVAKRFQRWVVHDVLPQIRLTGGYSLPEGSPTHPPASSTRCTSDYELSVQDQLVVIGYMFEGFLNTGVEIKLVESARVERHRCSVPSYDTGC